MRLLNVFAKRCHENSIGFYGLLFLVILVLMNVRQKNVTNFDCEVCSDKAGYFMYLPATFHYGFQAENYPKSISEEHGNGFQLDHENNRVLNKYTCGIAMLQAPFYGTGVLISKVFSINADPFSSFYLFFINIGAAFYLVLGMFFLRKWLNYYVENSTSLLTILVIFFGTNLYYYSVDESLMTHLYSFALFSIILYSLKTYFETKRFRNFLIFCTALALAILIRPTNFLFVVIALLLDLESISTLKDRLIALLSIKNILTGIVVLALVFLPQLLYWKYTYGTFVLWTYGEEGFTLWNNPRFATVWFSPQGGLFTYTPIILLSLAFTFVMYKRKVGNSLLVLSTFLIISYMFASWANPYFGFCNFGKRPMIEFLPILMLPIAYMFKFYSSFKKGVRYSMSILVLLCVYYNLSLTAGFDTCFQGSTWDWDIFYALLDSSVF